MTQKQDKSSRRWQLRQSNLSRYLTTNAATNSQNHSYEILSSPESREAYDAYGLDGLNGPGGPGGMDAADIFAELFTGGGFSFGFDYGHGGSHRHRTRGDDSVIPYDVTLEELYNGKIVKMNMEKEAVCGTCKG